MNQDTNNSTQNTNAQTQVQINKVDPKTVQAEVLGHLRTEKVGNPSLLFAFLAIIAVVMALLPLGTKMLQNPNSFLYKIVYGEQPVVNPNENPTDDKELNGAEINLLTSNTKLRLDNLIVQNFQLSNGKVRCQIYSYTGTINLDEKEMYLEIFGSKNENDKVGYVKLIGDEYDYQAKDVVLYNQGLSFNQTHSYYGRIFTMNEADYPTYDVETDSTGYGTLTCTKDSREIIYVFQNNYLVSMSDVESYKVSDYSNEEYLKLYSTYSDKATLLGNNAKVVEEEEGFTYRANINLAGYTYPNGFKDNNYYKENTLAKVIVYAQKGKGFDCK